jgi:HD-like signal output (HDOD) protein
MAQALAATELAWCLAYNYDLNIEKVIPCTMFRNLGHVILSFISVAAARLVFENQAEKVDKQIKKVSGWLPSELGVMLAHRWNLPELIVKTQYRFNEIKKSLSREDTRVILASHAATSVVILAGQKKSTERQKDIHDLMVKKLGVSRKGISKAFQEGLNNFRKENLFFYEALEQNGLLDNLLI